MASEGVKYVLVNGGLALRDGAVTGEPNGRVLRRTAHMPARPMNGTVARRATAKADGVVLDVRQEARAGRATGKLTVTDPRSNLRFESTALGVLQTTARWASVTGRGRLLPAGEARAFTAIVDAAGPSPGATGALLVVGIEGAGPLTIPLDARAVTVAPRSSEAGGATARDAAQGRPRPAGTR